MPAGQLAWIRRDLGADYQAVQVADAGDLYQTLGRATRTVVEWLRAHAAPGRAARVVAEQDLAGRAETEIAAYLRAEAAANVIYQPYAVSVLCPFDASSLPERVLHDAQRTHPELAREGVVASSPLYSDPAQFVRDRSVTAGPPRSAASIGFGVPGDLSGVRRFLRAELAAAGLAGEAAQALVIAVGEVVATRWPMARRRGGCGCIPTRGSWSAMCRTAAPGRTTRSGRTWSPSRMRCTARDCGWPGRSPTRSSWPAMRPGPTSGCWPGCRCATGTSRPPPR